MLLTKTWLDTNNNASLTSVSETGKKRGRSRHCSLKTVLRYKGAPG